MIDIFEENESCEEIKVIQENQLFTLDECIPSILSDEECNNYNISADDNKIPDSLLDKIKIEFNASEETNSKTLLPPAFYSLDKINEVLKNNFYDEQIINKLCIYEYIK